MFYKITLAVAVIAKRIGSTPQEEVLQMPKNRKHYAEFRERTLNELVDMRAEAWPDLPATCHHEAGSWKSTTWAELGEMIHSVALGLRKLGLRRDDSVCIVADTCRDWMVTDLAIISAGGVTVGAYTTITAQQTQYIIDHCEARFVVVENHVLLDKLLEVREELPRVECIIVMHPEEVDRNTPGLRLWQDVLSLGRQEGAASLAALREEHRQEPDDRVVTYIYTSGTTGPPKGAMLTHANFLAATRFYGSVLPVETGQSGMSFLPLAHALQRVIDYLVLYVGATVYYARDLTTVREDLQTAQPTAMGSVPRIFEKIYTGVQKQAAEKGPVARRIFGWSVGVGRRMSRCWQQGKRPGPLLFLQYQVAYRLVLSKIKQAMGGRIRVIGSGGAPISPEIQEFFHACGILILEAWGMTETTALGTLTRPDAYKFGTVGLPAEGVQIRLDEDGEILIKGPCVFAGYYKDPEKTAESFSDGWLRTGDVGVFDEDGFLRITDRKKDLIITAYGKNIAPQNLENALKTSPYISQAMVYGDRQKYLVALLTLDPEELRAWAEREGMASRDPSELAADPRLVACLKGEVDRINRGLASFENVRKFDVLAEDFSIEAGELTPTLKVKRKVVKQKYGDRIRAIYGSDWTQE